MTGDPHPHEISFKGVISMKKGLYTVLVALSVASITAFVGCDVAEQPNTPETQSGTGQSVDGSGVSNVKEVTNYKLDGARTYTGTLVNGKPEGEGVLLWDSGCIYRGQFKEGKYEGHGSFDWRVYNEDGSVKTEGWLYEGEFKNNTMAGCRGKLTLDQSGLGEGLIWIEGLMTGFPAYKRDQNAKGFIRFGDNTTYEGDIYIDRNGNAFRKGYGFQDYSATYTGYGSAWGCEKDELFAGYEGEFDYEKGGWIYGNGIMYYTDLDGKPVRYAKGFYSACHLLDGYTGEQKLRDGYTADMESLYIRFRENYDVYTSDTAWAKRHVEYLFAGASYFTFMNVMADTPFSKYFSGYDALDVGCGGSTTADWVNYYDDLIKPYTPDNVVFAVGGNDVANGATPETVYENYKKLMTMCRNDNPNVKFYIVGQWYTPSTVNNFSLRAKLNDVYFPRLASEFENTVYIPVDDLMYKDAEAKTAVDDLASYFLSDRLHMNDKGYQLWTTRIREYLDADKQS